MDFATDRTLTGWVFGTYIRGGTVVTCGSTDGAHGLRGNGPNVMRITKNALDRLSNQGAGD